MKKVKTWCTHIVLHWFLDILNDKQVYKKDTLLKKKTFVPWFSPSRVTNWHLNNTLIEKIITKMILLCDWYALHCNKSRHIYIAAMFIRYNKSCEPRSTAGKGYYLQHSSNILSAIYLKFALHIKTIAESLILPLGLLGYRLCGYIRRVIFD